MLYTQLKYNGTNSGIQYLQQQSSQLSKYHPSFSLHSSPVHSHQPEQFITARTLSSNPSSPPVPVPITTRTRTTLPKSRLSLHDSDFDSDGDFHEFDSGEEAMDLLSQQQHYIQPTSYREWRTLLPETSLSSYGSSGSPPVGGGILTSSGEIHPAYTTTSTMHELGGQRLSDQLANQRRLVMSQRSLSKDYHPLLSHGAQVLGAVGGGGGHGSDRWTTLGIARRVRPPLLSQGMMGSSLPSRYESRYEPGGSVEQVFPGIRPEFRKSSSQPTRAVSPALSYHSPTPGQMAASYGGGGQRQMYQHRRGSSMIDATMPTGYQPTPGRGSRVSSPSFPHHPILTAGQQQLGMMSGQSSMSSDWMEGEVSSSSVAPLLPSTASAAALSARQRLLQHQFSSASSGYVPGASPPLVHSTGDLYRHPAMMSSTETLSGYRSLEHGRHRPMLNRASTFDRGPSSSFDQPTAGSFERGLSFDRPSGSARCPRAMPMNKPIVGSTYHPLIHHPHLSDAVRTAQLITQYGVRRRVRPPLLSEREGMMGSSLPSRYEAYSGAPVQASTVYDPVTGQEMVSWEGRPEFRKSSSQPARTISPALSLHSPTQPGGRTSGLGYNPYSVTDRDLSRDTVRRTPGGTEYYEEGSVIKKRVLPQVPSSSSPVSGHHHRYSSEYLQSHHRRSPVDTRTTEQGLSDVHRTHHGTDHEVYPYQRLQQQESGEEQSQYQRQYSSGSRPPSGTGTRRASPSGLGGMSDSELAASGHLTAASGGSRRPSYVASGLEGASRHGSQTHLEPERSSRRESVSMQRRGSQSEPRTGRRHSRAHLETESDTYHERETYGHDRDTYGHDRDTYGHDRDTYGHDRGHERDTYGHERDTYGHHGRDTYREHSRDRERGHSRESDRYNREGISSAELMARLKDEGNIYEQDGTTRRHHEVDTHIRDHPLRDPELTSKVVRGRRGAFGTLEGAAEGVEADTGGGSLSGSRATLAAEAGNSHQSRSMARGIHDPRGGNITGGRKITQAHSYDEETARKHGVATSETRLTASQEKGLDEEVGSEAGGSGRGLDTPGDRTESGIGSGPGGRKKHGEGHRGPEGLNKAHSSSTQHLSGAARKRLGFRKKNAATFFVHRSEEVAPDEVKHMVKQASSTSDGEGSISGESASTWVPAMRLQAEGEVSNFVEGLGPGQLVGRQALAAVNYGDIQLSICERRGNVEVEVIRARNLMTKHGARMLPATYVKVYMMKQRKCVAKARTVLARRTLDPLYQQQLVFNHDYRETILQITVWGDYGRLEKKTFMGMAQICLDDLDLSNIVIGWYKLLPVTSATITNMAPSAALQEAREAKLAAMAGNMKFFAE